MARGFTGFPKHLHGHCGKLMTTYGGLEPNYIREDIPVMVDFGITHEPTVKSNGTMRKTSLMSYEESQQNNYIMDVDGNSFTSRFRKLLLSGSVVFKSSRYRQWFTERLHPFVDYVPVNYNLTDLPEKIKWIHEHPTRAAAIAKHASTTVQTSIRDVDRQCYMYRLALEYQELFE
mmetsp:Transcript_50803/g.54988  ORF Transcript_50803/g.54988 Transcript_50803/m.54988 type:complete len:175 (+) Transcript_50803:168-692(+)